MNPTDIDYLVLTGEIDEESIGKCDHDDCSNKFRLSTSNPELTQSGWRICARCEHTYCPDHTSQMITPDRFPLCLNCDENPPCWFASPNSPDHNWRDSKTMENNKYNDCMTCKNCGMVAFYPTPIIEIKRGSLSIFRTYPWSPWIE